MWVLICLATESLSDQIFGFLIVRVINYLVIKCQWLIVAWWKVSSLLNKLNVQTKNNLKSN